MYCIITELLILNLILVTAHNFDDYFSAPYAADTEARPFVKNIPSDKRIVNDGLSDNSNLGNIFDKAEEYSCYAAIAANVFGGFMQLTNISDDLRSKIEGVANTILNFSYVPYGLSGMNNGAKKKNFFQVLGFMGEVITPWFGNLKNLYLMRGMATGTDQIWVATDPSLSHKYPDGNFDTWLSSIKEIPKTCYKMLKEIINDPLSVIPSFKDLSNNESKGHMALLSSLGSIGSSLGYILTGKENIFGPIRDLSSWGLDFELLFRKGEKAEKAVASGAAFIIESSLDFIARFVKNNNTRLFINMMSHAAGRIALRLYKLYDPASSE